MAHRHKKRFGQNFLHNRRVIERIVRAVDPKPEDHLVEIGPGEAAITLPLARSGAKLDVIEIDRDLFPKLERLFAPFDHITLHAADALTFDYGRLEPKPLRVVGNLPYNISSPLIFHLLTYKADIRDMHFMLQKEVVERMTAEPGSKTYGRLSVMTQYHCRTEYLFTVGPGNFTPPPKVDSAIVRLRPRPFSVQATDENCFAELVRQAFSQRRKTLRNTLKNWLTDADFATLGIDPGLRAEALPVASFVRMANHLYEQGDCP